MHAEVYAEVYAHRDDALHIEAGALTRFAEMYVADLLLLHCHCRRSVQEWNVARPIAANVIKISKVKHPQ
jgi:hypothetical protein